MELIYAAMLLHRAKKDINEENVKKVMQAIGIQKTDAEVKALVAALNGVDIDKAIKEAATVAVAAAPAAGHAPAAAAEKKQDEKKSEEATAAGLSALFG
ncbi:50S ribosomal protein P1 [Candidatus Woesearchaeota archaeon]|nr:50S ribosomal protein P1 [Candidatus Woesearchaeota archaeon]